MAYIDFLTAFKSTGQWYFLCVLAVFAAILIYGIFFVLARSFNLQNLERTSKAEILQAFASLIMVIFIVGMVIQLQDFAVNLLSGQQFQCGSETIDLSSDAIEGAIGFASCKLSTHAKILAEAHESIYPASESVFWKLSQNLYFMGIPVFQGTWVDSWFQEAESYRLLNSFLTTALIGLNTILALLNYIKESMLTVYLPIGLFLRTFQPTRGIGALLIAIAIGLYFIFPIMFLMLDPGFTGLPEISTVESSAKQNVCFPSFSGSVSAIASESGGGISSPVQIASIKQGSAIVSKFYVDIMTQGFVALSITLILIRYMVAILGGDAYAVMRYVAKVV